MKTIEVYELSELDDEGICKISSVGYFISMQEAEKVKNNVFQIIEKKEIKIFETALEFYDEKRRKIIDNALSRLSDEEKKALGLI